MQPQVQAEPESLLDPDPEPSQPEPLLEVQPSPQPAAQVQTLPPAQAFFQPSLRPVSQTESCLPTTAITGLKRSHHSIDEALSSAQCVATAVLSAKDVAEKSTPVVASQSASLGADPYSRSSSQEGVCDLRQKQTPDLVLDLPFRLNSGSNGHSTAVVDETDRDLHTLSSPTGPESPDMTTAAERFAKQNQCTLKKNTKASQSLGSPLESKSSTTSHTSPRHSKSVDCQSEKDVKSGAYCITKQSSASDALPSDSGKKPVVPSFKPPLKAKPQIMKKPLAPVPAVPVPPTIPVSKDLDHSSPAPDNPT